MAALIRCDVCKKDVWSGFTDTVINWGFLTDTAKAEQWRNAYYYHDEILKKEDNGYWGNGGERTHYVYKDGTVEVR